MEVMWSEYIGGFKDELRCKVFCSMPWLEACCAEGVTTPEGKKAVVNLNLYPPGGKSKTAMVYCDSCKRWAPTDGNKELCIDCKTEQAAESFYLRLVEIAKRWNSQAFARFLIRLHWPKTPRFSLSKQEAKKAQELGNKRASRKIRRFLSRQFSDILVLLEDSAIEKMADSLTDDFGQLFSDECITSQFGQSLDGSEKLKTFNKRKFQATWLNHIRWIARDRKKRAAGCSAIMLPEDEQHLLEEIEHFQSTNHVKYHTTTCTHVNPYKGRPG